MFISCAGCNQLDIFHCLTLLSLHPHLFCNGTTKCFEARNVISLRPWCMMYILHGISNNWALWKVQGQSSPLILSPLAGAAHRSERRRPLISPTSSRCSAREREECKWVHSRKPSPAPSTLKSPLTLADRDILQPRLKLLHLWLTRGKETRAERGGEGN